MVFSFSPLAVVAAGVLQDFYLHVVSLLDEIAQYFLNLTNSLLSLVAVVTSTTYVMPSVAVLMWSPIATSAIVLTAIAVLNIFILRGGNS